VTADSYQNPLISRYATNEMAAIFGPRFRARIWRQLWIALAEAERELGLDISGEAIAAMRANVEQIDTDRIAQLEAESRHEVMAHIHAFGEVAPAAKGVIHLGATSAFVMDNADLIQHREALKLIRRRIVSVVATLREQALEYRDVACVGYTHLQPAQPTTVGKRITLWMQDLLLDLETVEFRLNKLRFRSTRGATGTEASFLILFEGDHGKVEKLNALVAEKLGFDEVYGVSSQTYTRKVDAALLATLSDVAQSASKFANDVRLLQSFGELQEPFGESQVGSSAMAHKRNPMRCERINALARHVVVLALDPAITAASQWLERTLDDSANKRIAVPEAYLGCDAVLTLWHNVAAGLLVHPEVARRRLAEHLPYLAAEPVLLLAARRGGDRQKLHAVIRLHALAATEEVRKGRSNDMVERLANDPAIGIEREELERLLTAEAMAGRAPEQVDKFIADWVDPALKRNKGDIDKDSPTLMV
jgi:adenylosuccinate lyase